ncbi:MAG: PUA domain-containing protein [Candidatus Njordarchaeales archaeon]
MNAKNLVGGPISKELVNLRRQFHYSEDVILRLSVYYGIFRAIRIIKALRTPPKNLAIRVNTLRADPDRIVEELRSAGVNIYPSRVFRDVLFIRVEGPFEVKKVEKEVVVKDKSAEGILLGANLYAPGVLRVGEGVEIGDEVNVVTRFGEVIAYGISKVSHTEKNLKGIVVEVKESIYRIPNLKTLRPFMIGDAYIASMASTQALKWLNPSEDEKILCVSPSAEDLAYIIQLTHGRADITVVSKTELEDLRIREALKKMRLESFEKRIKWHVVEYKYLKLENEAFDTVIVSPRNSKIGLRPRITAFLKEEDIIRLSRLAKLLLDKIVPAVRKGGRILYMVPSLDPAEGEFITKYLIETWNLEPIKGDFRWGGRGLKEIPGGDKALRTYPDIHDDIGFFASLLQKP